MSEVVNPYDPLIMTAVLADQQLRAEVLLLQRQRKRINALLEEKALNHEQRAQLARLLDWQHQRQLKLFGE